MVTHMSKAQEVIVSVLTGVLGAPIAAWIFWTLFNSPMCDPDVLTGSQDCVVTISGESRSWLRARRRRTVQRRSQRPAARRTPNRMPSTRGGRTASGRSVVAFEAPQ